jgi:hypothetical protein
MRCRKISDKMLEVGATHCQSIFFGEYVVVVVSKVILFDDVIPR